MSSSSGSQHLLWISPISPALSLDAATYLDTTRELRKLGWRVTLVTVGPAGIHFFDGVEVFCISTRDVYFLRHFLFYVKLLYFISQQWNSIDVILFMQVSTLWLIPLWIIRQLTRKRRPLFVMDTRTIHMVPRGKETKKDKIRRVYWGLMEKMGNHWADGRLAITSRMAQVLLIPPEKLWGTWPSGVNLDLFKNIQAIRQWPLSGQPVRLIYIGVLNYERNLLTLCQAVEEANTEGMSFALWLVGEGTERLDLESFAAKTNGRIQVMQPVPHNQIPQILSLAHLGVLPFPDEVCIQVSSFIKLFEYMAAGLPILATRIVCHTDVIGNGNYVFWADRADVLGLLDALRMVWKDRELLSLMGSQAQIAAGAWSWRESALKLKHSLENGLERF